MRKLRKRLALILLFTIVSLATFMVVPVAIVIFVLHEYCFYMPEDQAILKSIADAWNDND